MYKEIHFKQSVNSGSQLLGRREERPRSGYAASEGSGRGAALGHRLSAARHHDAHEEGQLRRGGGEGGAQEEMGEVVR